MAAGDRIEPEAMVDFGQLLIHQAGRPDRRVLLQKPTITAGRDPASDIHLDFPAVSWRHFRLEWRPGQGYLIVDQGSTHGTSLDGRPLMQPAPLRQGSVLWLGDALGNGIRLTYEPLAVE
jgi:pSer/pThr/pTyr-binding forkhead associated (FHA) protein